MEVVRVWWIICVGACGLMSLSAAYIARPTTFNKLSDTDFMKVLHKSSGAKRNHFREPPQYMLDLYNQIADKKGVTKNPLPHSASVVRALPDYGDDGAALLFSLSRIPPDEDSLEAEIHVHYHQLDSVQRQQIPNNFYKLLLYADGDEGVTFLHSQDLTSHSSGWRIFSVGDVVKKARASGQTIIRFHLKATSDTEVPLKMDLQHRSHSSKAPMLVLFNNADNKVPKMFWPKSSENSSLNSRRKRSTEEMFQVQSSRSSERDSVVVPSEGCELKPMKVDFADIGWSSWIVFPHSYDAQQCVGNCSFPLGQHLNPTNHATVQSILQYSETMAGVQHPSCVPTSYSSLTLLYYDQEDNVILKQFDHMIASQCGCR